MSRYRSLLTVGAPSPTLLPRAEAWLRPRSVTYNEIAGGLAVVITRRDRLCAKETAFLM